MQIKRTPEEVSDLMRRIPGVLDYGISTSSSPTEAMVKTLMAASITATVAWFAGGETESFLDLIRLPQEDGG